MKKFMKSKIFFSIISIALITGLILTSTYAWLVGQSSGSVIGGGAEITNAFMTLNVTGTDPDAQELGHIHYTNDYTWVPCADTCKFDGGIFYPGDAAKRGFTVDLEHNREVLIKVDFSETGLLEQLDKVVTAYNRDRKTGRFGFGYVGGDADKLHTAGIYSKLSVYDFVENDWIDDALSIYDQIMVDFITDANVTGYEILPADRSRPGVYYIFAEISANDKLTVDFDVILGIKGTSFVQSYFNDQAIELNIAPSVTAVQATPQAVVDVFPEFLNAGTHSTWLKSVIDDMEDLAAVQNKLDQIGFGSSNILLLKGLDVNESYHQIETTINGTPNRPFTYSNITIVNRNGRVRLDIIKPDGTLVENLLGPVATTDPENRTTTNIGTGAGEFIPKVGDEFTLIFTISGSKWVVDVKVVG